jgi:hypothetical protein
MNFLQQPVLFASDPSSSLVGLGLLITLTAMVVVISLVVTFALSSRNKTEPTCGRQSQPKQSHPSPACDGTTPGVPG